MSEFIKGVAIYLGILLAQWSLGGPSIISLIIGAIGGLACFQVAWEKIETSRTIDGFWLRNRGSYITLLVIIFCIITLNTISSEWWATPLGLVIGIFVGEAVAEKLGWGGAPLQAELEFRSSYIVAMVSAAAADGEFSKKERNLVDSIAKELFASLGFGHESDINPIIEGAFADPPNANEVGEYVRVLNDEFKHYIILDLCKVLFADGEMNPPEIEWFKQFQQASKIDDFSAVSLFSRSNMFSEDRKKQCLAELKLGEEATEEEIHQAYRKLAMKYHPDQQGSLPQHARELIAMKMVAINDAFEVLTNKKAAVLELFFKREDGATFSPNDDTDFECHCWLCSQRLRVPRIADLKSVRCSKCHCLAGLSFDPNQTE